MDEKTKRVLVCPLDWGLGHATRCIPLIREFIRKGFQVILAGDGSSIELLKQEFPDLPVISLKGYNIRFSGKLPLPFVLTLQLPKILYRIFQEHRQIGRVIKDNQVDILISDNRYGLWSKQAYSVFMTHQPNILPPAGLGFISPLLRYITRWFINKYDQCWIPDVAGENNLSGKLSHGYSLPENTRFIGQLSRFDQSEADPESSWKDQSETLTQPHQIVAIISGPEPQRTIFEQKVTQQLSAFPGKSLIIRGLPETVNSNYQGNNIKQNYPEGQTDAIAHLRSKELYAILKTLPVVICRGGYSTLMDLAHIGNKVICVPTPGQTEQIYLATKGDHEKKCVMADQNTLSISKCLAELEKTSGYKISREAIEYPNAINELYEAYSLRNTL